MLQINSLSDDLAEQSSASAKSASKAQSKLVITQVTSGVRNPNRVNIYINGKFSFSLDLTQVVDLGIKVGKEISDAELAELQSASEFGKLYQRALEWALMRPRSVWETRDYLKRYQLKRSQTNKKRLHDGLKPFPEISSPTIELVMDRLLERGFIDDYKFASFYIENRFVKKGISRKRLEMELRKKHIPNSIIAELLANSSRNEDEELAKMIVKKRQKYDTPKLIRYLVSQGFDYQTVKAAVEKLDNADGDGF